MYGTTRQFVHALEQDGQLRRVRARVDPVLEIAAIADRVSKLASPGVASAGARRCDPHHHHLGGHALLFEDVEGSDLPVLINAFGSYRRVEMALGACEGSGVGGLEGLADRLAKLLRPEPPPTLLAKLQKLPELLELARIPPRLVRSGACQQVVATGGEVDLRVLPLLRCWPRDGDAASLGYPGAINDAVEGLGRGRGWDERYRGRYITLGMVHTIHADDAGRPNPPSHNVGMYRAQLLGPRTLAMHWHLHHDGARHWRSWKRRGEPMPVAIALGGPSVLPYAATAPMPPGISELLLAGFLNRGPIELVPCRTVPLGVPAASDIVIEGFVRTDAGGPPFVPAHAARDAGIDSPSAEQWRELLGPGAAFEGPFGDHTGFYSLPDRYPLMDVTAITRRRDAVYPTTIVGLPPQEDYYLGKATERLFLPLLRTIVPDVLDYDLPMFGAFHNAAFLKIRKEYPYHARRVMHAIWGAGQMSWTKCVVVVDEEVDVHDAHAVLATVGEHAVPARDVELVRGPLDILDHAAPFLGAGSKMGLDATRKTAPAETHPAAHSQEPLAAELCRSSTIPPVLGEDARRAERRVREVPGVLDAAIPESLGGHWLLVRLDKKNPGDGPAAIKAMGSLPNEVPIPRIIVIVGPDADVRDTSAALFHWLAHADPQRDRTLSKCGRRVAFDSTPKLPGESANGLPVRDWPPIIAMDRGVRDRVEARWGELFGESLGGAAPAR